MALSPSKLIPLIFPVCTGLGVYAIVGVGAEEQTVGFYISA